MVVRVWHEDLHLEIRERRKVDEQPTAFECGAVPTARWCGADSTVLRSESDTRVSEMWPVSRDTLQARNLLRRQRGELRALHASTVDVIGGARLWFESRLNEQPLTTTSAELARRHQFWRDLIST